MIRIIADSTCNLSPETIAKYAIKISPVSIQFNNESYEEGIDIDRELFYAKIEELGIIPTSSQPSPARFADYYQENAAAGTSSLVITVTSKLSGTYDSAVLAQSMVPEADVEVFDSATISLGTGWMVLEAARMNENGASLEEILPRLEHIRAKSRLFLTPKTLKYLQMSGRVGRLKGAIASMLELKPIIALEEGILEAKENIRTRKKSLDRMLQLLEGSFGKDTPVNVAVIHARAPEDGDWLLNQAQARLNCQEILTGDLVASLAVHGGPGIMGLVAYPV
jgi:DegV family protein with EDD domain